MRKRVIALALSMVLLCAACGRIGGGKEKGEGQYSIWFRSISVGENGAAIGEELQSLPENGVTVESLMGLLLAGPEAMELTGPFPRNTFLRSWRMEGDTVFLDLSEAYGGLSGADLSSAARLSPLRNQSRSSTKRSPSPPLVKRKSSGRST